MKNTTTRTTTAPCAGNATRPRLAYVRRAIAEATGTADGRRQAPSPTATKLVTQAVSEGSGALLLAQCSINDGSNAAQTYRQVTGLLKKNPASASAVLQRLVEMTAAAMLLVDPWRPSGIEMAQAVAELCDVARPNVVQVCRLTAAAARLAGGEPFCLPVGDPDPFTWMDSAAAMAAGWAAAASPPGATFLDANTSTFLLAEDLWG